MIAVQWEPTETESFATGAVETLHLTMPIAASVVNLYVVLRNPIQGGVLHDITLTTQWSLYTDDRNLVQCPLKAHCVKKSCICENSNKPQCKGQCPDYHSDPANCGTCGNVVGFPALLCLYLNRPSLI